METAYAFTSCGAETDIVHINTVLKNKTVLLKYHILAIPGGFTYGDDIASGKILANELRFKLKDELSRFIADGKLIIGICNGFQVLVKMGLLPNMGRDGEIQATLSRNDSGHFSAKWVYLKNEKKCAWVNGLSALIYLPIAHAEGKFIPKDDNILKVLQDNDQIVFRYADEFGACAGGSYNPNGSVDDIAGICDPTGRILGMMPHPERHINYLQHPNWRRYPEERLATMGDGLTIFKSGVEFAVKNV